MNPAFQVGQQVGNNFSKSMRNVKDENAIESILSQAMSSEDPKFLQDSIGKILSQVSPERQGLAIQYLQGTMQNLQKKKEQGEKYKREEDAGLVPGLDPRIQTQLLKEKSRSNEFKKYGIDTPDQAPIPMKSQTGIQQLQEQDSAQSVKLQEIPPELKDKVPPRAWFNKLSKDQLMQASGSPYKEISEPAKAALSMLDADKKTLIEYDKRSQKYDDDLRNKTRIAKQQLETVKDIDKAVKSGNVNPSSWANIFKGFGVAGDKISQAMLNKDESLLLSSIPQLLEGWKEVFGVRLSDADLRLLNDKLPSIGKSPEANQAVLGILKKYADMTILRNQIGSELKKQNGGLRPLGYEDLIEERFDQMTAPIKIRNPDTGRVIEIPAYKVSAAINAGGKVVNE